MKILFLDVDGVLNNLNDFKTQRDNGTYILCEKKIKLLRDMVAELGLTVVLSSTWRLHNDHVTYLYGKGAIDKSILHKDWRTPAKMGDRIRGDEIQEWLEDHPEVTSYVILDDDSDMLEKQMARFVQTSFQDDNGGLTEEHVAKIKELFR